MISSRILLCMTVATVAAPGSMAAQSFPGTLPPGASLVAKHGTAVGEEALLKAASITTKGGMSMPGAGLNATFEMVQQAPNRMKMVTTVAGMGEIQVGFDGTTGWAIDPMQGPRLLAGKEFEQMRDEAAPRAQLRSPELFSTVETISDTTMGGQRCYLVKLVWKSGPEAFDCFSPTTGLKVGSKSVQQTAMGAIPVTVLYSDYKKFGDIMFATRTVNEIMGQQQVLTVTSVELGAGTDAAITAPPEIQALAKPKSQD